MVVRNGGKSQRPHFAHFKKPKMKCNGTSLLRYLFRNQAKQILQACIDSQTPFNMEWQCSYCSKKYNKDVLQQIRSIRDDFSIGNCTPDLALCDADGHARIVFELLVRRKLTGKALRTYEENGIILIQLMITEGDVMNVENKLHRPDSVSFCGNGECYNFQFCQSCFQREIFVQQFKCKKCGMVVNGYMVRRTSAFGVIGLDNLRDDEKQLIVSKHFSGKRATVADIVVYGKLTVSSSESKAGTTYVCGKGTINLGTQTGKFETGKLTDIDESQLYADLSIFPNPATSVLYIQSGELPQGEAYIYNTSGKLCKTVLLQGEEITAVEVADLSAGVYILRLGTQTLRFIKQ
jgi:hypothetical protein